MANNSRMDIGRHKVSFREGHLYVNGNYLGIKQWESDPKRWSSQHGREVPEYKGKSLEDILRLKGFL